MNSEDIHYIVNNYKTLNIKFYQYISQSKIFERFPTYSNIAEIKNEFLDQHGSEMTTHYAFQIGAAYLAEDKNEENIPKANS